MSGRFPALLLLFLVPACHVQRIRFEGDRIDVPLTIVHVTEDSCFAVVEARVAKEVGRFVIDTGATHNGISREFAKRAGLSIGVSARVDRHSHTIDAPTVHLPPIHVGAAVVEKGRGVILDLFDEANEKLGWRIDGILGLPLFEGVVVVLDGPASRLSIAKSVDEFDPARLTVLPLERRPRLPFVAIDLDGAGVVWCMVDTGCVAPLLLRRSHPVYESVENPKELFYRTQERDDAESVQVGRLRELRIEGATISHDVAIRIVGREEHDRVAPLLGSVLFRDRALLVDLGGRRIALGPEQSRSGTWGLWVQPGDRGLSVESVDSGGPAEAAGIRKGDSVRVRGGGAAAETFTGFFGHLAGRDEVELEVVRGDDVRVVTLRRAAFLPEVKFRRDGAR